MDSIVFAKVVKNNIDGSILVYKNEEIFVAKDDQLNQMVEGNEYLVLTRYLDKSDEWIGTEYIESNLEEIVPEDRYFKNQRLIGIVYKETPLGFKVCFEGKYSGLLYKNEIFKECKLGDKVDIYIKSIREDFRVDLSLKPTGYGFNIKNDQELVLRKLFEAGGFLPLSDNSDPDDIRKTLGISKKKFKDAIGGLYKKKRIRITDSGIEKA